MKGCLKILGIILIKRNHLIRSDLFCVSTNRYFFVPLHHHVHFRDRNIHLINAMGLFHEA